MTTASPAINPGRKFNKMFALFKQWVRSAWHKFISIDDTPQKKALGLGLGVFLGNFPGVGPVAAWVGAYFLKVNQATAVMGSFLTNTWLTFFTLMISVKLGSFLRGKDWEQIKITWEQLIGNFSWDKLGSKTVLDMIVSIFLGYTVMSFVLGALVYILALGFFHYRGRMNLKTQG